MLRSMVATSLAVVGAGVVMAQSAVPTEVGVNGLSAVTLHLQPFLTEEELTTLRLVASNDQALGLFVADRKGFAAMAASPEDGFVRGGAPVKSAVALADFPNAAAASTEALAACDALRIGPSPCVVVLEVAPAK